MVNKIYLKLLAYDSGLLDLSVRDIMYSMMKSGAKFKGPIPMPHRIKRVVLNRSPHVNKKSREHFAIKRCKRVLVLIDPMPQIMDMLRKLDVPSGVEIDLQVSST